MGDKKQRENFYLELGGFEYRFNIHYRNLITEREKLGSQKRCDNAHKKTKDHVISYIEKHWDRGFINIKLLSDIFGIASQFAVDLTYIHFVRERRISLIYYNAVSHGVPMFYLPNLTPVGIVKPYVRGDYKYSGTISPLDNDEVYDKWVNRVDMPQMRL